MPRSGDRAHFDVHPSVVYQLGESLISDAVQALIELVKNSYDADATYAKVVIDTTGKLGLPDCHFESTRGRIVVEDDGLGMNEEAVTGGWLLISNRAKRQLKASKKTTPRGRTPLGDKGLGRLGMQRLGEDLDVFTKPSRGAGIHFSFSWLDFATAPTLQDVDVRLTPSNVRKTQGTTIVISNLLEPDLWQTSEAKARLTKDLSRMISPYRSIRDFTVYVEVDGVPIDLIEVTDRLRNIAPIRYKMRFDGTRIKFGGRARLDFFRPSIAKEIEEFALIAESDHGKQFFKFLERQPEAKRFQLRRAESPKWYIEFDAAKRFDDLDTLEFRPGDSIIANPGPFFGEVDAFDLGSAAFSAQPNVFNSLSEYRNRVKDLSGIRVYRDGFAIRVDRDWLKLGAGWTSARSYYGLKPDNTLGYIALSARDNLELEETTDREGFKDTPYFRNFYRMLEEFKAFADDLQRFLGRSWVEFKKARIEQLARVDTRKDAEDLSRTISLAVEGAADNKVTIEKFAARMNAGIAKSSAVLEKMADVDQLTPAIQRQARESHAQLDSLVADAKQIMQGTADFLGQLHDLRDVGKVLEGRVASLRRQIDDMYEAVAVGITAEAIVHEVFQIADALTNRTKRLASKTNGQLDSKAVQNYLEHVRAATSALRKQVSFLAPALRYVRENREEISISTFLHELTEFYHDRLAKHRIRIQVNELSTVPFVVTMNRGKLAQILDNFVLNSEYWLRQELHHKRIQEGMITINVDRPFLRISDNGKGIDPSVESVLFEPFVTTKDRGVGRGLGLFIVKQLLDSDGCSVGIVPERNRSRRFHIFQIDLRGVIKE
jgi:signal transduction histidine kinase